MDLCENFISVSGKSILIARDILLSSVLISSLDCKRENKEQGGRERENVHCVCLSVCQNMIRFFSFFFLVFLPIRKKSY